jgi:acyl-CoA synthetase (AMP-forming)/AMP-acid ligase II
MLGPGAPFEMATEPLLGHEHTVFARRPRTLRQMFDEETRESRDLPWLVGPDRDWTFGEATADIDATAALLAEHYGVRPGDRVGIVAANSAEYAIMMWAVLTIGGIVTGFNGWWTTAELEYGRELTSPTLIAGDERRLARLRPGSVPDQIPVRTLRGLIEEARRFGGRRPLAPAGLTEDSPAVILFTSGTTGRPKGATLSHRNIINFALVIRLSAAMGAGTARPPVSAAMQGSVIATFPMFHNSGMVATLVTGPVMKTKLLFMPPGRWDPTAYLRLTAEHRVSSWSGVPTQYWRLANHPELADYDVRSVTTIGSGGAVFQPELVRALSRLFPHARLGNGYGMSETFGLGTLTGGDLMVNIPGAVGMVQPTVELQIRRADGSLAAEGEIGEIHLRSPSVFLGYWDNPVATAAVLDADRWYRTGDFGHVSGGLLFLEGRRRDLILRAGENIYPVEIENRLLEHPDVEDAAVIGVDHPELGQEVRAFVVRRAGSDLSERAVRDWCASTLAGFKVPANVEFRASLPYTETGKVMKHELEREAQPSPARTGDLI